MNVPYLSDKYCTSSSVKKLNPDSKRYSKLIDSSPSYVIGSNSYINLPQSSPDISNVSGKNGKSTNNVFSDIRNLISSNAIDIISISASKSSSLFSLSN